MLAISTWNPAELVGTYVSARRSYAWISTSLTCPPIVALAQYGSEIGRPDAKFHGWISCSVTTCPPSFFTGPEELRKSQNTWGMLWWVVGSKCTRLTPAMLPFDASVPVLPFRSIVSVTFWPVRSGALWSPAWVLDTPWNAK